jgi:NADPH:quinone reductase-like Zn-dependent oxidoreductase
VLLRVHAAGVDRGVWHLMTGLPYPVRLAGYGVRAPKTRVRGREVAGRVEAIGKGVTSFQVGDEVFGIAEGAFAEYACAQPGKLARRPGSLTAVQAAAVPVSALTALQAVRDHGHVHAGQKVLVIGASGGVGTFAVQIAKALGGEVTAVCSTANVDLARSLGADRVVDYTREDFTRSGRRYDLILGANAHHSIFDYRRALSENGRFVLCGGGGIPMTQAVILGPLLSRMGSRKVGAVMAKIDEKELAFLAQLVAEGKVVPVIERTYPLTGVPDAVRYLEQGHARGKLVITLDGEAAQT